MSTRHGNAYITQDVLKLLPSEVIRYFYTKKPIKQRNFDLENIYRLANEYDVVEKVYYGIEKAKTEKEKNNFKKMYKLSNLYIAKEYSKQISYSIASVIAQVAKEDQWKEKVENMIGFTDSFEKIEARIKEAQFWVENHANDEYKIEIIDSVPKDIVKSINRSVLKSVLDELADNAKDVDSLNQSLFSIARKLNIDKKEVFKSCYLALLGRENGPRLASFLLSIDSSTIKERFQEIIDN